MGRLVIHADRMSPHGRMQIADLLVRLDPVGDRGYEVALGIRQQFLKILTQLERGAQVRISAETMTILLDHQTSSERFSPDPSKSAIYIGDMSLNSFAAGVLAMMNAEALASLLEHPGATGQPREWLLQRFEELVFHDGKHVLLPLPEPFGERQGNYENPPSAIPAADVNEHGGLTPNRSPSEPPPRRFHNLHDATAWIQQNWPDFDLEATHRFRTAQDPIRLERMVNEMRLATEVAAGPIETTPFAPCFRSFPPSARGGWGCGASRDFFSPPSLLTDPGEPDGVAEMLHGPLARHFRLTASRRRRRKRSSDACGLSLNYSRTCFTSLCTVAAIRSSMSPAQRKAGRPYSYRFEPPS